MARSSDINQRIALVGSDEIRRQLEQIAKTGEQSFSKVAAAAKAPTDALSGLSDSFVTLNLQASKALKGVTSKAFVVGLAGLTTASLRFASGVADASKSLEDLAKTTGASDRDLLALRQAFRASGVDGDFAAIVAQSLGTAFHNARLSNDALQKSLAGGINVLKGTGQAAAEAAKGVTLLKGSVQGAPNLLDQLKGPAVFRGGAEPPKIDLPAALADPLKALKIKPPAADASPEEQVKKWGEVTQALTQVLALNRDVGEELAKSLLGTDKWRDALKGLQTAFATGNMEKFRAEVERLGLVLGPDEAQAQAEQYRIAVANLGTAWESLKTQAAADLFPTLTSGIRMTTESLRDATATGQAFAQLLSSLGQAAARFDFAGLAAGLQAAAAPIISFGQQVFDAWATATRDRFNQLLAELSGLDWSQAFNGLFQAGKWVVGQLESMFTDLWNFLKSIAGGFGRALGAAGSANVIPGLNLPQVPNFSSSFAAGGMVRGAGTGTSDSVPIWASTGEFVMNAPATRMNLPILEAMNALRQPIMPRRSRGFAMGGLVAVGAGGATHAVHVHFGDASFGPMITDARIAEGLVRHARKRAGLSAGKKPSTA